MGGAYEGNGSGRYGAGSGALGVDVPAPEPDSDDKMLVTLGDGASGAEFFSAGRKNGSSFHELSAAAAGRGGGAAGGVELAGRLLKNCVKLPSDPEAFAAGVAGAGVGVGVGAGRLLKNCVNPPSAEAESETPCEENPFDFDGPAEGGAGRGVSSGGREGGVYGGAAPETKMRVNSPGPASAGPC